MMLMLSVAVLLVAASAQAALVADFAMEEGTGSTSADSVSGNDPLVFGGDTPPAWSTDTRGSGSSYSLLFPGDSAGSWAWTGTGSGIPSTYVSSTSAFSVDVWFKTDDITDNATYPLLAALKTANHSFQIVLSVVSSYQGISIGSADSHFKQIRTTDIADPEATLADNQWHNLLVTFDGVDATATSSFDIILDGTSRTLGNGGTFAAVSNNGTIVGGTGNAALSFNGLIDDLKVYDTVIPEPATMSLLGIGGLLALVRRRRK